MRMRIWPDGLTILPVILILNEVLQVVSQEGEWSKWGSWSACSVTCGYGVQKREKLWKEQNPRRREHVFRYEDILECFTNKSCPVDGGWGYWGAWSECTLMCGGGSQVRYRECNNPKPTNGGKFCESKNFEKSPCNEWECPPLPDHFDMARCNETTFMCKSRLQCIPSENVCDETLQCHDGSDEYDCDYLYWSRKRSGDAGISPNFILLTVLFLATLIGASL